MKIHRAHRASGRNICVEPCEPRRLLSTYTVNSLSDAVTPVAGKLTLRQAVADANLHSGADTINFDPSVFPTASLHTITLTQGQINLTDKSGTTTITGPGAKVVAINGNAKSRIFDVSSGVTVSISGVTITDGEASVADSSGDTYGGAIANAGTLTIANSTLSGNSVNSKGYSKYQIYTTEYGDTFHYGTAGNGKGGAIYSTGNLTITSSTLSGNQVANTAQYNTNYTGHPTGDAEGGAVWANGPLALTSDTILGNTVAGINGNQTSGPAYGGGVYTAAGATITATTISGNGATAGSGDGETGNGANAIGGGVWAGSALSVVSSTITNNTLAAGNSGYASGFGGIARGGGVFVDGALTITGTTVGSNQAIGGVAQENFDGTNIASAGGGIYAGSSATLTSDTISENKLSGGPELTSPGGGAYVVGKLTMNACTVSGNIATAAVQQDVSANQGGGTSVGGGVATIGGGTITASTISGNTAKGADGKFAYNDTYAADDGGDGQGGGVYSTGSLTVVNSTIANNSAVGGLGGHGNDDSAYGGAIIPAGNGGNAAGGAIFTTASLTISDSTIVGNTITPGAGGAASDAGQAGGKPGVPGIATAGGIAVNKGTTLLNNTVVSADKANGIFSDIVGTVSSSSAHNLIGVGGDLVNGVNGNKIGITNPQLLALGNYGGPTQTMLPEPNSPVIDAGSNSLILSGVTTDQRGYARIVGSAVDIGSVELRGGSIAGTTYNDFNGDGKQESNEPGLFSWGTFIDSNKNGVFDTGELRTFSDSNGNYIFWDLAPGTYTLSQLAPAGWTRTQPSTLPYTLVLASGQKMTGINFGNENVGIGTVTGMVYNDVNGNGKQDSGDAGLGGRTVYADLYNLGRQVGGDPSTTTSSTGKFTLSGVTAGAQIIRTTQPTGWRESAPGLTVGVHATVPPNGTVGNAIFGSTQRAYISGSVFNDANSNGKQDTGEGGLGGWTVDAVLNNAIIETTTTDSTGAFHFGDLKAGTYTFKVVAKSGYTQTLPSGGAGEAVTLSSGEIDQGVLFGEHKIA